VLLTAGESIVIASLEAGHAPALLQLVNANRPHLRQWLPWVDYMQSVEDFEKFIVMSEKREVAGTDIGGIILYNGVAAGRIGVYDINPQNKIGAIGYWLGEAFSGKGIVTTACKAMIAYCFTELHLNRIEIKWPLQKDLTLQKKGYCGRQSCCMAIILTCIFIRC
jgi:ribosomal-protein-serine acetyltransferase